MLGRKISKINPIFLLLLGIAIGFLGELMPDDFKTDLTKNIENYLPLTFRGFWYICVGIVTVLTVLLTYLSDTEKTESANELADLERDKIIDGLTESYHRRLAQKLDERIPLTLKLKYSKEGTSEFYVENYFAEDVKNEKEIRSNLSAILHKHHSLLLLGKPGAGKTYLLLDLAVYLLEQAKEVKTSPVPVILDLSSWQSEKDFGNWYLDILVNGYGFNSKLAEKIIKERKLMPFFDGLDEIADESLREDCLEKLKRFRQDENYDFDKFIITSRIDEYVGTTADAPVRAEIEVEDLTDEQVEKVLRNRAEKTKSDDKRAFANQTSASNMLALRKQNPAFKKVILTPIYFNLANQIFVDTSGKTVELPAEEDKLQDHLVETFISNQMSKVSPEFSSSDKNNHYLAWLADKLSEDKNKRTFELTTFQPNFLRKRILYRIIFTFFYILLVGLVGGVFAGFFFTFVIGLIFGLIGTPATIETEDLREWIFPSILSKESWLKMSVGLSVGLSIGFFGGLVFGLFSEFSIGLVIGLTFGLVFGLVSGSVETASKVSLYAKTQKPYQRLTSGLAFNLLQTMFVFSGAFLILSFYNNRVFYFGTISPIHVLSGGFVFGLVSSNLYYHLVLRFCFYLEGSMPLRYVKFLEYATELRLLEQDGGQWRFRHKIIQDYFAKLETRQ